MRKTKDGLDEITFIALCRKHKLVSAVLTRLERQPNRALLSEYGIVPRNGAYHIEQVTELYKRLAPNGITGLMRSVEPKKDAIRSKSRQITQFIKNIEGLERSSEVKRFLLLILSEKFTADIEALRRRFEIPNDGFAKNEEVGRWAHFKSSCTHEDYARYLAYGWTNEIEKDKFVFNKIIMFTEETEALMKKYRLIISEYVSAIYVLHGIQNLELLGQYLTKQVDRHKIFALTPGRISFLEKDRWVHEDSRYFEPYYPNLQKTEEFFVCFRIFRSDVRKEDFDQFFAREFDHIKKELSEFIAVPVESAGGFGYHWLVYYLSNKLGMTRSGVNTVFTEYGFEQLKVDNFKTIKKRVRVDIVKAEGYKQV